MQLKMGSGGNNPSQAGSSRNSSGRSSRVIRTKNWVEASAIVKSLLGARYMLGTQTGDSVTVKYVREEWEGQWQYHFKITATQLNTKCAACGSAPSTCICDNPVL